MIHDRRDVAIGTNQPDALLVGRSAGFESSTSDEYFSMMTLDADASFAIEAKRGAFPDPNGFSSTMRSPGAGPLSLAAEPLFSGLCG